MSGEPKFTPGPWEWKDDYQFNEHADHSFSRPEECENFQAGRMKLVGQTGRQVVLDAWGAYADDLGLDIKRPDAHLIAAAPELYAALEEINTAWHEDGNDDCPCALSGSNACMGPGATALAKARGET
jgi:hypothetical protein